MGLAQALEALAAAYRDLDGRLATLGVECRACGQCCDFRRNDYRLYASFLERALLVNACGPPHLTAAGLCGYLVGGRCSAHPWRPLGCRTFFCAPEHKGREQDLYEAFQGRIRALTDQHGLAWDYRPLFPETASDRNQETGMSNVEVGEAAGNPRLLPHSAFDTRRLIFIIPSGLGPHTSDTA